MFFNANLKMFRPIKFVLDTVRRQNNDRECLCQYLDTYQR